jgi:hypothetical protein
MNNTFALPLALLGALLGSPSLAQVGFSIQLGQPNYYGGLNIQGFPNPQLYNSRPVFVRPLSPEYDQPVYLRVPAYQRQNWGPIAAATMHVNERSTSFRIIGTDRSMPLAIVI